jgi:phosphonopyruvate decarboxylase
MLDAIRAAGFTFVTGVPDSGLARLTDELERAPDDGWHAPGTREDVCVALAVGAYLAGRSPLVYMKSAGLGTAVDALTSLAKIYEIPVVLLVSWAGYRGRDIPHHNVIGEAVVPLLDALGMPTRLARLDDPEQFAARLAEIARVSRGRLVPGALLGIPEGLHRDDDA